MLILSAWALPLRPGMLLSYNMAQSRLKSALAWSFAMNWGEQTVLTLLTFVLAHLLGPHDFGLVAIAGIYLAFVQLFLDQGFGPALIQRRELEDEHLDSVFWAQLLCSVILMAISVAMSNWWAGVNNEPLLVPVILALSTTLPIQGLTVVQVAILKRNMSFSRLAIRSNVAALAGGASGVLLAVSGYGVWALVAQQVVSASTALLLLWGLSDWRPRLRFSWRHFSQLFRFASGSFAGRLGVFVHTRSDALLMGVFFGPAAVGLYRLADRLMNQALTLTTRSITLVSLPHLSECQGDPAELKVRVLGFVRMSVTFAFPALACLAGSAPLIVMLLGPEWAPAAPVLMLLCAVGTVNALTLFVGPLLQAVSKPHSLAVLVWVLGVINAATLASIGILMSARTAGQQIVAVALSRLCLAWLIYAPVNLIMASRLCGISLRELLSAIGPALIGGFAGLLLTHVLSMLLHPVGTPVFVTLVLAAAGGFSIAWVMILCLDVRARSEVHRIKARIRAAIFPTARHASIHATQ